jgi:hypothetical protein
MARYRIAHDLDRTWLSKKEDGTFFWGEYEGCELFPNYKKAKEALDSVPVEMRMYNTPYKPRFMKFYDSEEHRKKEEAYRDNMRLLRAWGEI